MTTRFNLTRFLDAHTSGESRWLGKGAQALGLPMDMAINKDDYRHVLMKRDPRNPALKLTGRDSKEGGKKQPVYAYELKLHIPPGEGHGVPHGLDGKPIPNFGGGPCQLHLSAENADVVVQRSFSNKPKKTQAYADFFEKIESYVNQISGPAMVKFGREASPLTHNAKTDFPPDPVFKYPDTLSSRAGISDLRDVFKDDVIAIVGVGGTGSYGGHAPRVPRHQQSCGQRT